MAKKRITQVAPSDVARCIKNGETVYIVDLYACECANLTTIAVKKGLNAVERMANNDSCVCLTAREENPRMDLVRVASIIDEIFGTKTVPTT